MSGTAILIVSSDMLTWGRSTLVKLYTLTKYYNVDKVSSSLYIYRKPNHKITIEDKTALANELKISYRTCAKYIDELPPQITFNGMGNFFVPVNWNVLRQMVSQRLNTGNSYFQVNNWVRVLLYFILNCGRFHTFTKGILQMVKELKMNKPEAVNNIEDLLAHGTIKRVLNGYRNKSGFGVVSSYVLNDTSLLAAEFYEVWKR